MRRAVVAALGELTAIDAPTGDAPALRRPAELLARRLAGLTGRVRWHESPAGPHLEARFGPRGGESVLLLCHHDTVWPAGTAAERPFALRDGFAHGPGVFDMRAGIVACLGAIEVLTQLRLLDRELVLRLTADEESGGRHSRDLILDRAQGSRLTLVPEPPLPGGGLKTRRKGWLVYELNVRGRASHAGLDPEAGVSAIDELVDQLLALRQLRDSEAGTTVNVGTISAWQRRERGRAGRRPRSSCG